MASERTQQVRDHLLDTSDERYPELAKLSAVHEESNTIGAFLDDGLREQEIVLATYNKHGRLMPCHKTIERILADHYGIDLAKVDAERMELLENVRSSYTVPE